MEDFGGSTTRSRGSSVSNSGGGLRSLSDRNTSSVKPKQLGLEMLGHGGSKPKRVTSAPDLTQLSVIYHKKSTYSSLMKRQRSISLMDLEHYAVDDDAAGDLLMQFMEKISESAVKKPKCRSKNEHQNTMRTCRVKKSVMSQSAPNQTRRRMCF